MSNNTLRNWTALPAAVACLLACVAPVPAAQQQTGAAPAVEAATTPPPEEIDEAIRRGIESLYGRMKPDLMWEEVPYAKREMSEDKAKQGQPVGHGVKGGQWGGLTSLAAYTLLACGEDPEGEKLSKAIAWLTEAPVIGTYALGMRTQVWLNLPGRPEYKQAMLADGNLLGVAIQGNTPAERKENWDDKNSGTFDYLPYETPRVDLSATQYGVLGVWAYAKYGGEVPPNYWNAMEQAWLKWQQPDGGWAYAGEPRPEKPTAMSITTAGVASLFVTQDYLHASQGINCQGNIANPAIDRGLAFLVEGFPYLLGKLPVPDNETAKVKASKNDVHYTLYGVERIGVASGLKYFGDLDWYAEGATWLLDKQNKRDGGWGNTQDTCFALLFLSAGRQPVFMNKLAYSVSRGDQRQLAPWNQRPRDLANLSRYIEAADERELNWQTINFGALDSAAEATRELHDAPVTYLAGSRPLSFNDAETQALKDYVLQGGLLFANADCGARGFAQSVVDLGEAMFADQGYEFRVLPDSHPIYTDQKFNLSDVRRKPTLLALSNGVRELIVLVQGDDLAREWQLGNLQREEAFQVGTNLYLYAVDKQPQPYKGQTHLVDRNTAVSPDKTLKLARIEHAGNWDPEPAGWGRMAAMLHNDRKIDLQVEPVDLASADLGDYDVAHLTGTGELALPPEALAKLAKFVENGGTLLVDAAGGDAAFAQSAEAALATAFGDRAGELATPLPTNHPVYAAAGQPIETVDYRLAALEVLGAERKPRLRGIAFENRLGVILSTEDLSQGLVGTPVGGVVGPVPADATRLVEAALLYAAK